MDQNITLSEEAILKMAFTAKIKKFGEMPKFWQNVFLEMFC